MVTLPHASQTFYTPSPFRVPRYDVPRGYTDSELCSQSVFLPRTLRKQGKT
jgi:hypothetical protein